MILLDIHLPGMSGHEVIRILKQDETTREIPVVAISADAMPADIQEAMQAGFEAYITKPINIGEFDVVIDGLLKRSDNQ